MGKTSSVISAISGSFVMFKRCLIISFRNPENIAGVIFVPAVVMAMFGLIFGNIVDIGISYIDYIVPGVILQSLAQCAATVSIAISVDMQKGIIDRFRSMDIAKSAFLNGHVLSSLVRNIIVCVVVIAIALLIGFRPTANFLDWLIISGIFILYMLAITWIAVICGLLAKTPEAAGTMPILLFILPYLSSGYVPVDTMPTALRVFATYQPMTPIIDSLRALMLDLAVGNSLILAIIWSVAIIIVSFVIAVALYRRRVT